MTPVTSLIGPRLMRLHEPSGLSLVQIPSATFLMGDDAGGPFERPTHEVVLETFWMSAHPVSNAQFGRFIDDTGYVTDAERVGMGWSYQNEKFQMVKGVSWRTFAPSHRADHPVVLVSWLDATAFCKWAGLRLPTEAEWERTARGTRLQSQFPWGDSEPTTDVATFAREWSDGPPTTAAGTHSANNLGIHDLVGNVWQWCSDWYGPEYYSQSDQSNPTGPIAGTHRVRRGGSWNVIQAFRLRCANRGAMAPDSSAPNVGFRCAATLSDSM